MKTIEQIRIEYDTHREQYLFFGEEIEQISKDRACVKLKLDASAIELIEALKLEHIPIQKIPVQLMPFSKKKINP